MRTGLQSQVIKLYREFQRAVFFKPVEVRPRFRAAVRAGFTEQKLSPRDVQAVEYLLRRGRAKLNAIKSPDVFDIN